MYNSARTQEIIRNRNGAPLAEAQLSEDLSALGRSYRDVAFEKLKALYPGLMQRTAANDAMNEAARNNDNEGITRNKQRRTSYSRKPGFAGFSNPAELDRVKALDFIWASRGKGLYLQRRSL